MTFEQLQREYINRYDNSAYHNDPDTMRVLEMIATAATMGEAARGEFAQAFNFELAIDGEVYLGGKRSAANRYPHLLAEGPSVGLKIVTR